MGTSSSRARADIVVVGAGISGLRIARITADRFEWNTVLVEKQPDVGGRVSKLHGGEDDAGAFRVLEHHERTMKLVDKLGLELEEEPLFKATEHGDTTEHDRKPPSECLVESKRPHLNKWQARADTCGHHKADRMDAYTGYDGGSHFQSTSKATSPPGTRGDNGLVVRGGMHMIPARMKQKLVDETPLCTLLLQHRVVDIVKEKNGGYTVTCMTRDGMYVVFYTPRVVLACPPMHLAHLSIVREWAQPLLHSIVGQSRMRIYATLVDADKLLDGKRSKRLITDTMLRQTIIPPTGNRIQVCYASGKFADFWCSMFMQSREMAIARLQEELQKALKLKVTSKVKLMDVAEKYWPDGITSWRGGMGRLVHPCAIYHLHKTACPNVVWAGDAVAQSHNGWIQSTLKSVYSAIFTLRNKLKPQLPTFASVDRIPPTMCGGKFVVVQGRVLNMKPWIKSHPGGVKPILNHLREDITALWLQYHQNSPFAWAQILQLQCGWVAQAP